MKNRSDSELVKYLETTPADVLYSLVELMDSFWQRDIRKLRETVKTKDDIPAPSTSARTEMAETLTNMLRYFGSHGLAYTWRSIFATEPGASYHEILFGVVKTIHKGVKGANPLPRIATVKDYECILCEDLLRIQFQGRSESEITEMLMESGLDKEAVKRAAPEVVLLAAGGTTLLLVTKVVGRKTVTAVIERVLIWVIARYLGKEAALVVAARVLKGMSQKALTKLLGFVGWALLAWDVVNLAGPASRITIPCVSLIAATRTLERTK